MQLYRFCIFIVFIILNKKTDIEYTAKAHEPGLCNHQYQRIKTQPPKNTVIIGRDADKHQPGYKGGCRYRNSQGITYITGTKPKAGFQVKLLATNRAVIVHIKYVGKLQAFKWIRVLKHGPTPAPGTFHS